MFISKILKEKQKRQFLNRGKKKKKLQTRTQKPKSRSVKIQTTAKHAGRRGDERRGRDSATLRLYRRHQLTGLTLADRSGRPQLRQPAGDQTVLAGDAVGPT